MRIEIVADWWLVPLAITIAAFGWFYWCDRDNDFGPYGAGALFTALVFGVALIVSLVAWLVWALVA